MATKNIIYTISLTHDSVSLSNHVHSMHNANFDKNTTITNMSSQNSRKAVKGQQ